jgi:hypothetical protein
MCVVVKFKITVSGVINSYIPFYKTDLLKDRVGGRTLTTELKCKNGEDFWDLGGQWVGR